MRMLSEIITPWLCRAVVLVLAGQAGLAAAGQAETVARPARSPFAGLPVDIYVSMVAAQLAPDEAKIHIEETCTLCTPVTLTLHDVEFGTDNQLFLRSGVWGKDSLAYLGVAIELGSQRLQAREADLQNLEINVMPMLRWMFVRSSGVAASLYGGSAITVLYGNAEIDPPAPTEDFHWDTVGLGLGWLAGVELQVEDFSLFMEYRKQPNVSVEELGGLGKISLTYTQTLVGLSYHFR